MKICHNDDYLIIEDRDKSDPYSGFSISARISNDDSTFTGSNKAVHFDKADKSRQSFEGFVALINNETRIELTESCYLKLNRQSRGDIHIEFQIHRNLYKATLKGQLTISGENSTGFLYELGKIAFDLNT